jgi:hypothetical protein
MKNVLNPIKRLCPDIKCVEINVFGLGAIEREKGEALAKKYVLIGTE